MCTPSLSAWGGGELFELSTKWDGVGRGLTGFKFLEGVAVKEGEDFFQGNGVAIFT